MPRVMVVDDNDALRRALCRLLERNGYDVVEAPNGRMALTALRNHEFDVVITDVFMPDTNGYQFVVEVRDIFPSLPIIMMSGGGRLGRKPVLDVGAKLGAHRLFEKPFRMSAMLEAVRELTTEDGAGD